MSLIFLRVNYEQMKGMLKRWFLRLSNVLTDSSLLSACLKKEFQNHVHLILALNEVGKDLLHLPHQPLPWDWRDILTFHRIRNFLPSSLEMLVKKEMGFRI